MGRAAPFFGRFHSIAKSSRSKNVHHIRLVGHSRSFTIYTDHPSFNDVKKYSKKTSVTLLVDGRVVKDFYSDEDRSYKLRLFLTEYNVLRGTVRDRSNIDLLYTKLASGITTCDPVSILRDYPYYAMSIEKSRRVYDFDTADSLCDVLGHSIQKQCRGHCHYKIKDICDEEGHTCIPYESYKFRINGFPGALVKQQIDALIRHGSLVCHNDNIFTAETFRRECFVKDFLKYPHDCIPLEPNSLIIPDLSEEQCEILDLVSESRIAVLCGGAGTGKTRCIAAVACAFSKVILAAPTGKAARRMVQSCRDFNPSVSASTLHSLLGIGAPFEVRESILDKIPRNGLLVVDEASMLDLDVMYSVVSTARDRNLGLLFVGDPNQLPPVSRGDVFANVIEWARQSGCIVELTDIHRQAADNPITRMGHHICSGLPSENVLDYADGDLLQVHEAENYRDAIEKAIAFRRVYSKNVFDCQIISPWSRVVSSINMGALGSERPLVSFYPGDYVMCSSNVSEQDLSKFQEKDDRVVFDIPGDDFVTDHIYKSKKMLDTSSSGTFTTDSAIGFLAGVNGHSGVLLNENVMIDDASNFVYIGSDKCHANAITVHKSQGSEWPTVILVMCNTRDSFSPFLNKKLLYTAITRAKKRLIVIGNPESIKWGVDRPAPRRNTLSYV